MKWTFWIGATPEALWVDFEFHNIFCHFWQHVNSSQEQPICERTQNSFDIASFQSYLNPEEASGCCHSSKFVFWPLFWKHWFSLLNLLHKLWRSRGSSKHASKSKNFFEDYPDHHRYGETEGRLEILTFCIFPYSVNNPNTYTKSYLYINTNM